MAAFRRSVLISVAIVNDLLPNDVSLIGTHDTDLITQLIDKTLKRIENKSRHGEPWLAAGSECNDSEVFPLLIGLDDFMEVHSITN